jgi:hypothetical protein
VSTQLPDIGVNIGGDSSQSVRASNQARDALGRFTKGAKQAKKAVNEFGVALTEAEEGGGKNLVQWVRDFSRDFFFLTNLFNQAGQELKRVFALAEEGARTAGAEQFFLDAGKSLNEYRQATQGLLSDSELMKKVNLADTMGIQGEAFKQLAKIAQASAVKTGQSYEHMLNSIVVGSARESRLLLDNLGIIIDTTSAREKYVQKLREQNELGALATQTNKQLAEQLSDEAQKVAFLNAAYEAGGPVLDQYIKIGEGGAEKFDRFKASVENLATAIGKTLAAAFGDTLGPISAWLNQMAEGINTLDRFGSKVGTLAGLLKGLAVASVGAMFGPLGILLGAGAGVKAGVGEAMSIAEKKQLTATNRLLELLQKLDSRGISVDKALTLDEGKLRGFAQLGSLEKVQADWVREFQQLNRQLGNIFTLPEQEKNTNPFKPKEGGTGGGGADTKDLGYVYQKEIDEREKLNKQIRDYHKKWRDMEAKEAELRDKQATATAEQMKKLREEYQEAHAGVEKARENYKKVLTEIEVAKADKIMAWAGMARSAINGDASATLSGLGGVAGGALGAVFGLSPQVGGAIGQLVGEFLGMLRPIVDVFLSIKVGFGLFLKGFEGFFSAIEPLGLALRALWMALGHLVASALRPLEPLFKALVFVVTMVINAITVLVIVLSPFVEMFAVLLTAFLQLGQLAYSLVEAFATLFGADFWTFAEFTTEAIDSLKLVTTAMVRFAAFINNFIVDIVRGMGAFLKDTIGTDLGLSTFGDKITNQELLKMLKDPTKDESTEDNTEATDENTKAVRDLTQELRNLPAGYKVAGTMYRSQSGMQSIPATDRGGRSRNPRDIQRVRV